MKNKILLMLVCTFGLAACQNIPPVASEIVDVTLNYNVPVDKKLPPGLAAGTPEVADVKVGNFVDFKLDTTGSNNPTLLLVIMGLVATETSNNIIEVATPFENGDYTLRLTRGNNNVRKIAEGKEGIYKYSLIDITGNGNNNRPPLDPKIRVGPGN